MNNRNLVSEYNQSISNNFFITSKKTECQSSFQKIDKLTHNELKQIINEGEKIQCRQKQELINSAIQFEKFHSLYQKQSLLLIKNEQRVEKERTEIKQKLEALQNRNNYLEKLNESHYRILQTISKSISNMISSNSVLALKDNKSISTISSDFSNNFKLLTDFEQLQKICSTLKSNLQKQIQLNFVLKQSNLILNSQIKFLKQKIQNYQLDYEKIKRKLKVSTQIIQMCQKQKIKMNNEIMQNTEDFEKSSPNKLINMIGSLKIQLKELKRINNDLQVQINQFRNNMQQRSEIDIFQTQRLGTRRQSFKSTYSTDN